MTGIEKSVLKLIGLAALYVLASPVLLIKKVLALRKELTLIARIRGGTFPCEWCKAPLQLNQVATCAACRGTTPGSLLRCSLCGARFSTVTCEQCRSTARIR
jgi:RecJ-like exonuclease